jgi:hypothetical protein
MTAHARWNAHTRTSLVTGVRDHDPDDLAARPRHTWVTSPVLNALTGGLDIGGTYMDSDENAYISTRLHTRSTELL